MVLFKRKQENFSDDEVLAVVDGNIVATETVSDPVFAQEMMGKTLVIEPELKVQKVVSPVNGKVEVLYPSGHAFAIRMKDQTSILVHIGVDTARLGGKGFTPLTKQGANVHAGQPLLKVDFPLLKKSGYAVSVMTILVENPESRSISFKSPQNIQSAQSVLG